MNTFSFLVLESRLPFLERQLGDKMTSKKFDRSVLGEFMYEVIIPADKIGTTVLYGIFSAGIEYGRNETITTNTKEQLP